MKILIAIPRGYEAGYLLVRIGGVHTLSKPGMPTLIFDGCKWSLR